jgi:hypothetical protein
MALLRNREVEVIGVSGGEDPSQLFTVRYRDGSTEQVPLNQLTFGEDEHEQFKKTHGERLSSQVKKLPKKDYQEVVDSQNPEKIKQKQKDQQKKSDQTPVQVPVSVKPADVQKAK